MNIVHRKDVIAAEDQYLRQRRARLFGPKAADQLEYTRFGIALSGGGIRSATINLGFLKTLQRFDLVRQADYLSTVSGGGYTGAYLQATLLAKGSYEAAFAPERITHMRTHGDYLIPGQKPLSKLWHTLVLAVAYLVSWIMSLTNLAIILGIVGVIGWLIWHILGMHDPAFWQEFYSTTWPVLEVGQWALLTILTIHFLINVLQVYGQGISRAFNQIEAALLILAAVLWLALLLGSFKQLHWPDTSTWLRAGGIITALVLLGFVTNPNALGFHRYYRNQLARAFLFDTGVAARSKLWQLAQSHLQAHMLAPYPLINTCLNILSLGGDQQIKGTKSSDYFLLSPLYCGAKLTGYVPTRHFPGYKDMTLAAAITISAAALNPGMGTYSNPLLSMLLALFNARLGFWVNNPLRANTHYKVWWPIYFLKEMSLKLDTQSKKVNISDGGHIENLAVYELLRRRCRLIIAVDAGADPEFRFDDLENLTIRARNELGIDICFRPNHIPEEVIRPRPSHGYSKQRFAIADLYLLWEEITITHPDGRPWTASSGQPFEALVNYKWKGQNVSWDVAVKARTGQDADAHTLAQLETRAQELVQAQMAQRASATGRDQLKIGTLVYVKSSVTAPQGKPLIFPDTAEGRIKYDTYKYKIYHPSFPHEPTSDQFFDPVQWEAYFQLGQYLAADVLGIDLSQFPDEGPLGQLTIKQLIDQIDAPNASTSAHMRSRSVVERSASTTHKPQSRIEYRM